jgi:tellurite methyltransferase
MSEQDRTKWNARYRDGAYESRVHASAIVERWAPDALESAARAGRGNSGATRARALDVACGAGRNALALARIGFAVDALDVAEEALQRARATAVARGLTVDWRRVDLDDGLPAEFTGYDLIVVIRYLNRALLPLLADRLCPGGLLVCEIHMATELDVIGPTSPQFRLDPGELTGLVPGLAMVEQAEGVFDDPDGRAVALARLVGRRTG